MQNESIKWIVETEMEYIFDKIDYRRPYMNLEIKNNLKSTRWRELIKWDPISADCKNGSDQFFTENLIRNLQVVNPKHKKQIKGEGEVFYKFLFKDPMFMDTLLYSDRPEVVEQKITKANYKAIPYIYSYKVKQLWYYDESLDKIENVITSFKPIMWIYNGEILSKKFSPFSIHNPIDTKEGFDLNNSNIIWIMRSSDDIEFNSAKELKGSFSKEMEQYIFEEPKRGRKDMFRCKRYLNCSEKINLKERDEIFGMAMDTIIYFRPSSKVEYSKIPAIEFKEIVGYRVNQYFYYNQKERALKSKLVEIGPLFERRNNYSGGNFNSKIELRYYIRNN